MLQQSGRYRQQYHLCLSVCRRPALTRRHRSRVRLVDDAQCSSSSSSSITGGGGGGGGGGRVGTRRFHVANVSSAARGRRHRDPPQNSDDLRRSSARPSVSDLGQEERNVR